MKAEIKKQNLTIELAISAKYYLDADLAAYAQNAPLQCFHENQVLIKLPVDGFTKKHMDILKLLVKEGYVPVIAHPEKYKFFNNAQEFNPIMALGCMFQVNIISLSVVTSITQQTFRNASL